MSDGRVERLLVVAKEIVRLEQLIAMRKAEFHRLSTGQPLPLRPVRAGRAARETYRERVRAVFVGHVEPIGCKEIAEAIGEPEAIDTVRTMVSKLKAAREIERVAWGLYRLVVPAASIVAPVPSAVGDEVSSTATSSPTT